MRKIICHYHIYKNSGTSFDTLLTSNFGDNHICFDGPFPFFSVDQEQLDKIISRKPGIVAFSSHQIHLPVPVSLNYQVLPVVFIRHPLLRISSVYKFKRQIDDGTNISIAACKMNFDEWVSHCFSSGQEMTHVSNGQTRILGAAYRQKPLLRRTPQSMEYDINQAIRNINNVPLLARTEYFNEDVSRFPKILAQHDIDFSFKKIDPQNSTSKDIHQPISDRVKRVEESLSQDNYEKIINANMQDQRLFEYASSLIDGSK